MISFLKRQDRSSVWPKATGLTGVKVNVNYVSGSKAYAFEHHKDFMFCSGFFPMHFHEDFAASWGIKIQFSFTVYHWSFGKTSLCIDVLHWLSVCDEYVCIRLRVGVCTCIHVPWGDQRSMLGIFLNCSLPYFSGRTSHWSRSSQVWLPWLVRVSVLPPLSYQGYRHTAALLFKG